MYMYVCLCVDIMDLVVTELLDGVVEEHALRLVNMLYKPKCAAFSPLSTSDQPQGNS